MHGRCGHRRHAVDPAEDVVVGGVEPRDLQCRRDEDRSVQADAGRLLEHASEPPDAVAAVALARDEDRRSPAPVVGEPAAHELTERLEVALVAEVLLRIGGVLRLRVALGLGLLLGRLDDAAEARTDGVDEHEVGEREPKRTRSRRVARASREETRPPGSPRVAGLRRPCAGTRTTRLGRR